MLGRWTLPPWRALTFILPMVFLAACSGPTVVNTPPGGATLNLLIAFPTSLDPTQAAGGDTSLFLDSVFSGLMRYDAAGDLQPDLAKTWSVSSDRTVYTFTLRHNATFHNGDPVTAASIVYAINRACDPAHGSPVAGDYLGDIQGVKQRLAGQASSVSGVQADGNSIVRFTLTHPDDAFLAKLTFPITYALDQRTVEAGGANWWQHPNGSGPFRLTEWQPQSEATLTRFPEYYGPAPNLAAVKLHSVAAISNLAQAFASGQLDMLPLPPDAQSMATFLSPQVSATPSVRQDFHVFDIPALEYLAIDAKAAPFDDVNVRRALNLAFNKPLLIAATLGGDGWPAGQILPPEFPGYQRNTAYYPFNPAAAKAAFAASRYGSTIPTITLASGDRQSNGQPGPLTSGIATMIQQALGWNVSITYVPDATIDADLASGHPPANLSLTGWQADYTDPSDFLDLLFHSGHPATNLTHYSNPAVDTLLNMADEAPDAQQRITLYHQAEAAIMRDAPIVPLFYNREYVLLNPQVTSLPLLPDGSFDLRDARKR